MQRFISTKVVLARPMNRADYNIYRGWQLPADEDGADEGYLVEYQDGGKPNHPGHAGYISWSPKEQFDKANVARPAVPGLAPHQQRVIDEKTDLDEEIAKLHAFFAGPLFTGLSDEEQARMHRQFSAMAMYSGVLADRICAFDIQA